MMIKKKNNSDSEMYLRLQETEEQITAANMQIKSSTLHAPLFFYSIPTF